MKTRPYTFVFCCLCIYFFIYFKLALSSLQSNKRSSDLVPSSPPEPRVETSRKRAPRGSICSKMAFVISAQSRSVGTGARAPLLRGARSGGDLGPSAHQSGVASSGAWRFVCQAAHDAEQCCHTPGAVFGNTEAVRHSSREPTGAGEA